MKSLLFALFKFSHALNIAGHRWRDRLWRAVKRNDGTGIRVASDFHPRIDKPDKGDDGPQQNHIKRTVIEKDTHGLFALAWRGNYTLWPGNGNGHTLAGGKLARCFQTDRPI